MAAMVTLIDLFQQFIQIILHLDVAINNWVGILGVGIYFIIFIVIFAETGLVVTPFLPGDSFLFALGALTAIDNAYLSLPVLLVLIMSAALSGDVTNYSIGKFIGPKIFSKDTGRWLNRHHLDQTSRFYEKHGGKTIIIARFAPIIRTFAPFVAGIGKMRFTRFISYSVVGAITWVSSFLVAGHFFGNIPQVKTNFHIVIFAIIIISLVPVFLQFINTGKQKARS